MIVMVDIVTFWIYVEHFKLPPIYSSIGFGLGQIFIAFTSLIVGIYSDRLHGDRKVGRRKIFILIGLPLQSISFILLFSPHVFLKSQETILIFLWLCTWSICFHVFYAFINTPYYSLVPELTMDDERVEISLYMNIVEVISGVVGIAFVLIFVGYISEQGGITGAAGYLLFISVIVIVILNFTFFLPMIVTIHEPPKKSDNNYSINQIKHILSNKDYSQWLIVLCSFAIAEAVISTLIIDFATDFLGFDSIEDLAVFTLILTGSGIFGYFFWSAISNKKGKNLTLKAGLICNLFSLPTTILLGKIDFISNYNQGLIFAALIGFSFSSVYLLSYAIIADIIDNEERKTKINKSGLYSGFNTIPYNLAQTIGIFISGLIVYNLGIMGPIAAIFIGISLVYSRNSNFDPFLID